MFIGGVAWIGIWYEPGSWWKLLSSFQGSVFSWFSQQSISLFGAGCSDPVWSVSNTQFEITVFVFVFPPEHSAFRSLWWFALKMCVDWLAFGLSLLPLLQSYIFCDLSCLLHSHGCQVRTPLST